MEFGHFAAVMAFPPKPAGIGLLMDTDYALIDHKHCSP